MEAEGTTLPSPGAQLEPGTPEASRSVAKFESKTNSTVVEDDKAAFGDEPKTNVLQAVVFTICGTAQLFYWNALLNMVGDITINYYPEHPNLSDTLTACYNTANMVSAIFMTWRGALNMKINLYAGVGLIVCHILTAVCVTTISGTAGVAVLHVVGILAGTSCGFYQSGHYALAASMPKVCSGWVSQGNGICGIVTFGLWMLFSEAVLKGRTLACLWWTMGIGALFVAISTFAGAYLSRQPDVGKKIEDMKARVVAERNDPEKPSYWSLFQKTWPYTIGLFWVFFVTLLLYPAIGPFRWNFSGSTQSNLIMGMFQVGDFVGRSIPQLAGMMPFVLLTPKILHTAVISRIVFLVLFILMWKQKDSVSAWGNFGWQIFIMLAMAITNGWFATCELIRAPSRIENPAYRARAGAINLVGLLLGIVVGLWCSKLVVLGS